MWNVCHVSGIMAIKSHEARTVPFALTTSTNLIYWDSLGFNSMAK